MGGLEPPTSRSQAENSTIELHLVGGPEGICTLTSRIASAGLSVKLPALMERDTGVAPVLYGLEDRRAAVKHQSRHIS